MKKAGFYKGQRIPTCIFRVDNENLLKSSTRLLHLWPCRNRIQLTPENLPAPGNESQIAAHYSFAVISPDSTT
jgi:hypothetical protein